MCFDYFSVKSELTEEKEQKFQQKDREKGHKTRQKERETEKEKEGEKMKGKGIVFEAGVGKVSRLNMAQDQQMKSYPNKTH